MVGLKPTLLIKKRGKQFAGCPSCEPEFGWTPRQAHWFHFNNHQEDRMMIHSIIEAVFALDQSLADIGQILAVMLTCNNSRNFQTRAHGHTS
jgi:hypothetical protein